MQQINYRNDNDENSFIHNQLKGKENSQNINFGFNNENLQREYSKQRLQQGVQDQQLQNYNIDNQQENNQQSRIKTIQLNDGYNSNLKQNQNQNSIKIYVTLKKPASAQDNNGLSNSAAEYKKMILMVPSNVKISMLKRQIEREFQDLFPKEPTFICGKLEDEYGYSLSNNSFVSEQLKNGDRVYSIQESIYATSEGGMNIGGDVNELLFMLKGVQQNVLSKLSDHDYQKHSEFNMLDLLSQVIPLGFSTSRTMLHNTAVLLNKVFLNENLDIFEDKTCAIIFNLLITLLKFWIGDLIYGDNFLLSATVDLLEVLVKSSIFASQIKSAFVINHLMKASKLEQLSSQTRSRVIKIISYLSKGEFANYYYPKQPMPNQPEITYEHEQPSNSNKQIHINNGYKQIHDKIQSEQYLGNQLQNQHQSLQNKYSSMQNIDHNKHNQSYLQSNAQKAQQQDQQNRPYINSRQSNSSEDGFKINEAYQQQQQYTPATSFNKSKQNFNQQSKQRLQDFDSLDNFVQKKNVGTVGQFGPNDHLVNDYVSLLGTDSTPEMQQFAISNLDSIIDEVVDVILDNPDLYLKCLSIIELTLPKEFQQCQIRILNTINKNLNERCAVTGLGNQIIQRILKGFTYQGADFQQVFLQMISNHLSLGKYRVDIPTIISMVTCPYVKLQELGVKILSVLSDPSVADFNNYEMQFENQIKFLLETSLSRTKSYEFKNHALQTLANLSLKDSLRQVIVYNNGIEAMLYHLRNDENLDGQRLAAKALLNLSVKSRDIKLKIVTELGDEIRKMSRNDLDSIVAGYLQTLVQYRKQ